jgi:hypothetical protein
MTQIIIRKGFERNQSGELLDDDKLIASKAENLPQYIDIPMNLTDMHIKEHEYDS